MVSELAPELGCRINHTLLCDIMVKTRVECQERGVEYFVTYEDHDWMLLQARMNVKNIDFEI